MFNLTVNDNTGAEEFRNPVKGAEGEDNYNRNVVMNCPSLITGMSHELRTHMNAIVAFSYLMKDSCCSNTDREEFSKQILGSCEQLITLFDSFLDSAIIDTGSSKADSKVCKLENLFDDLLAEFRENSERDGLKEVEIISENHVSATSEIFLDRHRVFRVLRSLLQTALRNTRTGYVKVGYYYRDNLITCYVLDSGQGYFKCKEFLQTEDLNESLVQHNDMFTAINLTLAKKLVLMLGGSIWIECNGLAGSGIYFTLPARSVASNDLNSRRYINSVIAI
jgi:signal transduction histidine kinase